MSLSRKICLAASIFMLIISSHLHFCHAQKLSFTLNGGISKLTNHEGKYWDAGASVAGEFFYHVSPDICLGTRLGFIHMPSNEDRLAAAFEHTTPAYGYLRFIELFPSVRLSTPISQTGNWHLIGQLGAGAAIIKSTVWTDRVSEIQFGMNGGIGLTFGKWEHTRIELLALYHFADADYDASTYVFTNYGKANWITLSVGLLFGERYAHPHGEENTVQFSRSGPERYDAGKQRLPKSENGSQRSTRTTERQNAIAVIIGIEKYRYAPDATYAERDAELLYNTAVEVLGVPEHNIYYAVNERATKGEFDKLFGREGWLAKRASPESEVYVYYSGHGAPDIGTREAYLIPYDVDTHYSNMGYKLRELYENMNSLTARSVTLILDACFVGQSREGEALLADSRPVAILTECPPLFDKVTVFSAAQENQLSSGYPEQMQGLFTHFFCDGLRGAADDNGDRYITVLELHDYIKNKVFKTAAWLDKEQTPTLVAKDTQRVLARY